ncbi:right-handed parallel beta-helix repeat-containing protein, partial [Candidatus Pelagibacter sp.]|nr:right-handed parallel beta-helix repeat-containing protein [Candidatus Pelagibacter sp.]
MNIKKVIKNSLYTFFPFLIILFLLFSAFIIKKDITYGHLSYSFWPKKAPLVKYYAHLYFKKIQNTFAFDKTKGLEQVNIYISEKKLNKLLSNVPISADEYHEATLIDETGLKETVNFKYKGSNPLNWLFEQKEIRIKRKKKNVDNMQLRFDYRMSQVKIINDYVYYRLAKLINKIGYDVKLLEVYINNESKGIYLKRNVLREGFLRANKLMPVNIYKGEQKRYSDRHVDLASNYFHNSSLWQKISYLNSMDKDDFSDLDLFLSNLIKANSSKEEMKNLIDFGNLDSFSNFAAFQIITHSIVFDNVHNARLIIDPWSGKKYFITHDGSFAEEFEPKIADFDYFFYHKNHVFRILSENSIFLNEVFKKLDNFVNKEKVIDQLIDELNKVKDDFKKSFKRDVGNYQRRYFSLQSNESINDVENIIHSLKERKIKINKLLKKNINATWEEGIKNFSINNNDILPISGIHLEFDNINKPSWIVLDLNNNNKIDDNDKFFYPNSDGEYNLDITLFANRGIEYSNIIDNNYPNVEFWQINIQNTKFNFLPENKIKPKKILIYNRFAKEKFEISKSTSSKSFLPRMHNVPIYNEQKDITILSGYNNLEKNLILDNKTIIEKGTIFEMCKSCSLIFKNQVKINGTKDFPVIIRGKNDNQWGTFAIIGKKSSGSSLSNVEIEGGTGAKYLGINFFSNLSIHNSENINIKNITIRNNKKYDDMVHIIYSKNIYIENSKFINSHLDTIDVDISENVNFKNIEIINSGNDGIDFMESQANLENVNIYNSIDKGLSVGENSKIKINNSDISNNKYGIVSKDNSTANIYKSKILNNEIQLSVY